MTPRSREDSDPITYGLVPRDTSPRILRRLNRALKGRDDVLALVERRSRDRRQAGDRRGADTELPTDSERRRIRGPDGRRIAERRATLIPVPAPDERLCDRRIVFVERIEPSQSQKEDLETARLVARIQAGEGRLFSELYLRYFDRAFAYFRLLFQDSGTAERTAQRFFVGLLDLTPTYELGSRPFRAWLFTHARSVALDQLDDARRDELTHEPGGAGEHEPGRVRGAETAFPGWLSDQELLLLIDRLAIAQREVLMLRFMLDLDSLEVAELLDCDPDRVRALQEEGLIGLRSQAAVLAKAPSVAPLRADMARTIRLPRVAAARQRALAFSY